MSAPTTPTRRDVLADIRLALDALDVARGHLEDAAGEAGPYLPTPLQQMRIRITSLASQLGYLRNSIEAGGPIGWERVESLHCSQCGRIGDHSTSCPEVAS